MALGRHEILLSDLYPIEIVQARYQGVYEGGRWVAFGKGRYDSAADGGAFADDITCGTWWMTADADLAGRGNTPNEALDDLLRRWDPLCVGR